MICGPIKSYNRPDSAYAYNSTRYWHEKSDDGRCHRVVSQDHAAVVLGAWCEVLASRLDPDVGAPHWDGLHREDGRSVAAIDEFEVGWDDVLMPEAHAKIAELRQLALEREAGRE